MQRFVRWRRSIASVVLLLIAIISVALPIADARAEIASVDVQSHVEQSGSPGCPPVHDEIACQLCRVLRLAGASHPVAAILQVLESGALPPQADAVWTPAKQIESIAAPRAPPGEIA